MLYRTLVNACADNDSFEKFISSIPDGCTEDIVIYHEGPGGYVTVLTKFLDFFNRYEGTVTIVDTGFSASCDANLLLFSNTKKVVSYSASMVIHKVFMNYSSLALKSTRQDFKQANEHLKMQNTTMDNLYRQILNDDEYKIYNSGENLHLHSNRIIELAAKAEELWFKKEA